MSQFDKSAAHESVAQFKTEIDNILSTLTMLKQLSEIFEAGSLGEIQFYTNDNRPNQITGQRSPNFVLTLSSDNPIANKLKDAVTAVVEAEAVNVWSAYTSLTPIIPKSE
jgi:hypothetical protein